MKRVKSVRDPLYNYVGLSEKEVEILDQPEVQRLRYIRQQGPTSIVYPSSTHTRFCHSIGVMHLSGKLCDSVGLGEEEKRAARIAGLLHDTGHGPFSHTSEKVALQMGGKSHEEISCTIVDKISDRVSFNSDRVKEYILGEDEYNLVNGKIDVDRMDYLKRDSLFSGFEYGDIDTDSIIRFARIENGSLMFDRKCAQALKELLMARVTLGVSTYRHHSSRVAEAMIRRSLRQFSRENSVDEMMRCSDFDIHKDLVEQENSLYQRVLRRNLYKRAYTIKGDEVEIEELERLCEIDKEELVSSICERSGIDKSKVVVSVPELPDPGGDNIRVYDKGQVKLLSDISDVVRSLYREQVKNVRLDVYCQEGCQKSVEEAAGHILDY